MPSAHGIVIEIIGDEKSYLRSVNSVLASNTKLDASFKQVGVNANLSADAQIAAAVKSQEALRANALALSSRAATLPGGSREQAAASLLAADAQTKYARSIGISATKSREATGAFGGLGKSFAFVSAGFLGVTLGASAIDSAIHSAEDLAAAQKALDVAILHTGGNVGTLAAQYLATAKAAAQFGVDQVAATRGLSRATVLTGDAASAQRAYQEALVISKATGREFNTVLIATSKGQAGITTALRRYGILVDATMTGQEQFNLIMKRFGGQAEANTTATERFAAEMHNFGAEVGKTALPAVEGLLGALGKLLGKLDDLNNRRVKVNKGSGHFGFLTDTFPKIIEAEFERFNKMRDYLNRSLFDSSEKQKSTIDDAEQKIVDYMNGISGLLDSEKKIADYMNSKASKRGVAQWASYNLKVVEQIAQAQAALTRGTQDDVAAAQRIVARIKHAIANGLQGKALVQALQIEASALGTIWAAEDAAAQKRAEAAQAAKDKILAKIQDSIDPLRLEVALSRAEALGKPIAGLLKKLRSAARAALASGKLNLEQQKEAWDQITLVNQQLADQSKARAIGIKQANTRALVAGLKLTDAQRAELRARLSQLDSRGRQLSRDGVGAYGYQIGRDGKPIHVHTSVHLDGKKVASSTTKHQERRRRRNSSQRRGPNTGG